MRKAFDTPEDPYLPRHILYRQKEQFSDGVGYRWIDQLRAKAEEEVLDWSRLVLFRLEKNGDTCKLSPGRGKPMMEEPGHFECRN